MSMDEYVIICSNTKEDIGKSNTEKRLVLRTQLLESLTGLMVHKNIIESCIFIQINVKKYLFYKSLKKIRINTSKNVIKRFIKKYIDKTTQKKKERLKLLINNRVKTTYYRRRFLKMKKAACFIQYMFRKSYSNISYSSRCRMVREIQYLNQTIAARNFVIQELRKKIKKEQITSNRLNNKWYRRNILESLVNIDVPS
tara:strand:+ start:1862 stop:2455 length:594 start_codon:yes stop_codon:yes gene_type:complete